MYTIANIVGISSDDLAKLVEKLGGETKANAVVTSAEKTVDVYTSRYVIDDDMKLRLVCSLSIYDFYKETSAPMPEKRKDAYEAAMRELRDIRDGKFDGAIPVKETLQANVSPASGGYGGATKLNMAYGS